MIRILLAALMLTCVGCVRAPHGATRYHNLSPHEIGGTVHVFIKPSLYPDAHKATEANTIYNELEKYGFQRTNDGPNSKWVVIYAAGVDVGRLSPSYDIHETSQNHYHVSRNNLFVHQLYITLNENDPKKPPRWKARASSVWGHANRDAAFPFLVNEAFKDFPGVSGQKIESWR